MNRNGANTIEELLTLQSKLSEIALIPAWIEQLASRHGIPKHTQFAMDVCLEEVLSNIIRHGYAGAPDHTILVRCTIPRKDYLTLIVDDEAPPFNPLLSQDFPSPRSLDRTSAGGRGILLLKQFADTVNYELKPKGNRLTISFTAPEKSNAV